MNPVHEQALELRFNGGNTCITDESGRIVAYTKNADAERLFIAAPDMARALRDIREALISGTLDSEGAAEVCERALRKAGVLP